MIVFVDFDGTITDIDTFDALVREAVGDATWDAIDAELVAGRMTLRDGLRLQASHVRKTEAETIAFLETAATVDPTFAPFVDAARAAGAEVHVVSSGIRTVIARALERAGVDVPIFANEVDFAPQGWTMSFIDDSANGHDKAARVRAAREAGIATVYVGDGISDFTASHEAGRVFAKRGKSLERYCRAQGIDVTPFDAFSEITYALFAAQPSAPI